MKWKTRIILVDVVECLAFFAMLFALLYLGLSL